MTQKPIPKNTRSQCFLAGQRAPRFTIEYSYKDKSTDMAISFVGDYFDPADCEDELSFKMLCWAVGKIIHTYDESSRLNTLRFDEPTNPSNT